jgi:hypothetical protein
MDQVHLNVFQKAVAVQRAEAGGAQKVSILSYYRVLFRHSSNREPEPLGDLRKPGRNFAERTPKIMILGIVKYILVGRVVPDTRAPRMPLQLDFLQLLSLIPLLEHALS